MIGIVGRGWKWQKICAHGNITSAQHWAQVAGAHQMPQHG